MVVKPSPIRLVVGLGNPGPEYADTRHNVGFAALAQLQQRLTPGPTEVAGAGASRVWLARQRGRSVWLLQPQTYMNASGDAVARLCIREGLLPGEVLVVYDDADLPLGRLRLRRRGSSGGHRGVESIIARLGSEAFARLRIGIGRRTAASMVDHVLSPFETAERPLLETVLARAVEAILVTVHRDITTAMNHFNGLDLRIDDEMQQEVPDS